MAERAMSPIQRCPPANTLTDLWTVPDNVEATVNLHVCNRGTAVSGFTIVVAPAGEATADQHYLYDEEPIDKKRAYSIVEGLTLRAGAVVRVGSRNGRVAFSLSRIERDFA